MRHAPALQSDHPDPWLTRKDVSGYLKKSERSVDRMAAAGVLTAYRIPGFRGVRFRADEVRAALCPSNRG
jgi:excisionase family DNA binding protein